MTIQLSGGALFVERDRNALYGLASSRPIVDGEGDDDGARAAAERARDEVNRSLLMSLTAHACGGWRSILDRLGVGSDVSVLVHTTTLRFRAPVLVDHPYSVRCSAGPSAVELGRRSATHTAFDVTFDVVASDGEASTSEITMTMVAAGDVELGPR